MVFGFSGSENVQAVQKYITGLDARRLSKFPEYRYFYYQIFQYHQLFQDTVSQIINSHYQS